MAALARSLPLDLLEIASALVEIPSVSRHESAIADLIEQHLMGRAGLSVVRIGDNVIARTEHGFGVRVLLGGHLDTVPPFGGSPVGSRLEGERLFGLGATDMKGGLAVLLDLACRAGRATASGTALAGSDLTVVFYVREEVDRAESGLLEIFAERPDLLKADVAILAEPTGGRVEAGCQGTLRARVTLTGERAHTARPWMGKNAIHRLGPLLAIVTSYKERRPVLDGISYRESLQAVRVSGGVAGNVVPDHVELTINYRFAPDRTPEQAFSDLEELLVPALMQEEGDRVMLEDAAAGALPNLDHPVIAQLVRSSGKDASAKLGWTDVSFFAVQGVPATNFGPGDPTLAHTRDERVSRAELEEVRSVFSEVLGFQL